MPLKRKTLSQIDFEMTSGPQGITTTTVLMPDKRRKHPKILNLTRDESFYAVQHIPVLFSKIRKSDGKYIDPRGRCIICARHCPVQCKTCNLWICLDRCNGSTNCWSQIHDINYFNTGIQMNPDDPSSMMNHSGMYDEHGLPTGIPSPQPDPHLSSEVLVAAQAILSGEGLASLTATHTTTESIEGLPIQTGVIVAHDSVTLEDPHSRHEHVGMGSVGVGVGVGMGGVGVGGVMGGDQLHVVVGSVL